MNVTASPLDYYVLEWLAPKKDRIAQLIADDAVIRFDDDGAVVPPGPDGNVERISLTVPRLPGMTALVVDRASLSVLGRPVEQLPVIQAATSSAESRSLQGPGGALARVEIRGLKVVSPGAGMALQASRGTPSAYRWELVDGEVVLSRTRKSGDRHLHLLVAADGPPQAAVPHYDMPDNPAGLYGPVLGGASLRLDHPAVGTATVTFDPPLAADRVEILLATNDETSAHAGLPHEAVPVSWTAEEITGVWTAVPRDAALTAAAGGDAVLVADLPGELPLDATVIDVTPAARALLQDAYAAGGAGDLELAITATSATAGELAARAVSLAAVYRFDSVGSDGVPVALRGRPATAALPLPAGLVPRQLTMTVDGRFGAAVRVAASDGYLPGRRSGLRLVPGLRGARRIALTSAERLRPLARVTLLVDADEPAELLVEVAADRGGRIGAPIADPVALPVTPSPAGAAAPLWLAADLPPLPPQADAVWVMARATAGIVRWYAESGEADAAAALISTDDGATWAASAERGCAQLHVLAERPEPAPLTLHWPHGLLSGDVLSLPAARTRIETTGADAVTRLPDESGLAAVPLEAGVGRSVTFRKEAVSPVADDDLDQVATLGEELLLTFSSDRDCDLRILDATLRYDPEQAP